MKNYFRPLAARLSKQDAVYETYSILLKITSARFLF